VPEGFIEGLISGYHGAYLGRGAKHSEIGFWCVRLGAATRQLLHRFADLYRSDRLFGLTEWHSAYAWDCVRLEWEGEGALGLLDLTPGGHSHVWFQSPLRLYLDHLKGKRKAAGRSPERRGVR
jgi:hypothetical protein